MSHSEQRFYDDVLNHFKDNDAIFTMLKSIMLNSRIPPELSDIILGNIVCKENIIISELKAATKLLGSIYRYNCM